MHISRPDIGPDTPLHKIIIEEVKRRVTHSDREYQNRRNQWRKNDEIMVAYVPEDEADARRRVKRDTKGKQAYTTIRVPYAYGVTMSLHAYMASVFLSRSPVFQFDGVHGEGQNQVMALEALLDYQYRVGMIAPIMFSWLYDISKYGAGVVGTFWNKRIRHCSQLIPTLDPVWGGVVGYEEVTEELVGYQGNEAFNVSVYDILPDPRHTLRNFQKGEYFGSRQRLSWQTIKEREAMGAYVNVDKIDPRIVPNFPSDNDRDRESRAIERPSDDVYNIDLTQAGLETIKTPEVVPVYEMYVRLVPNDWNLGPSTYPVLWVFTVTADWRTVISATPYGAYHCEFPFHIGEIEMDAFALCNRGIPEILEGVQTTMDWLLNSRMYNVRAVQNNLFLVDAMRVNMKDLTDPLPGGLIRKQGGMASAYDKPLEQLQVNDVTSRHPMDMEVIKKFGEQGTGISDMLMGVPPQGGRRTATESRQTAASGTSRSKVMTEYLGGSGIATFAQHLVSNSQQYYDGEMKLRIVGNLAQYAGLPFMQVTPDTIAGRFDYVVADGTMPLDRYAQLSLWKELLTGIMAQPQIAMQFDVARIFMWMAQMGGLRNVESFRIQVDPMQVLMAQAGKGNVVPIGGKGGDPSNLTQPPGMGNISVGTPLQEAA